MVTKNKFYFILHTLELQLFTEPLNVHSVISIGIVFVPIPASIVKSIEGIDIKQTSLFITIGNTFSSPDEQASIPNSRTHKQIIKSYNFKLD